MRRVVSVVAAFICVLQFSLPILAQQRVDSRHMYERIMVVLPLVGAGTVESPKRPMFAPVPKAMDAAARTGIIGFTYVLSDDGKFALCEFVARDQAGFRPLLPGIAGATPSRVFSKGVNTQAEIELEFRKYKKDFDFNKFGVHIQ